MRSLYLGKIRQDLYKGSPGKISIRDLCTRSLYQSSVGKISVRDLMARSLYRSLEEVSWQDLLDHSLCEPAQSKCPQHRKSHFIRKFKGKMPRPRLGPEHGHTLCASLHSRNWTFHKSHIRATFHNRHQKRHLIQKFTGFFTGKMPRPRLDTGHTLCASLHSRNWTFHKSHIRATFHNRHQKSHFLRKFTGKMPRPRLGPEHGHTLCASLHSRNWTFHKSHIRATFHNRHQKSHFIQKFTGKMPRPRLGPEHGHTLCASLHSRNWTFHKSHIRATLHNRHQKSHSIRKFIRKFTGFCSGKMPKPRLGPEHGHTLCASLHSRNWTFHKSHIRATFHNRHQKSHFRRKFTGKMPRPRLGPEHGHTLCASLRSRNWTFHKSHIRATFHNRHQKRHFLQEMLQEKCRRPDWAQNTDTHFARACTVEIGHFTGVTLEPRFTIDIRRATLYENLQDCASLHSRNWTFHKSHIRATFHNRHQKSHFIPKFTGKMPRPRLGPKARRSRCASLGSRNACQDFTGATLCGNLQVKCRRPA